jgi:hypothetical protein
MSTATDTQRYPLFGLNNSLPVAAAVRDAGGVNSEVSKAVIAGTLKCSATSGAFLQRIASARAWGLIEGRGSYRLSEAAKHFYFPTTEKGKRLALMSFLGAPPVFRELLKRLDGNRIPTRELLSNILHRESGVPDSWKARVAGFFLHAAEMVGAMDAQGFLRYAANQQSQPATTTSLHNDTGHEDAFTAESASPIQPQVTAERSVPEGVDVWNYSHKGKSVRLETPSDLPLALWQKLNQYLQVLKPEPEDEP